MTDVLNMQAAATEAPAEEKASNASTVTCDKWSSISLFNCH